MKNNEIIENNKKYWNTNADEWFGTTSLPQYGVEFITENELQLFGDVYGKRMLEIGCGSGHSIKYHAESNPSELWGLDISHKQLENAKAYLAENNCFPKLICSPMEDDCGIPEDYFDVVYSIYAVGWASDINALFKRIASYLKKDGIFIFSWKHPISSCVAVENEELIFNKSYFDEEWQSLLVHDMEIKLRSRKISTYINALVEAGFVIERMVEQTSESTLQTNGILTDRAKKAKILPLSFVFKARKA